MTLRGYPHEPCVPLFLSIRIFILLIGKHAEFASPPSALPHLARKVRVDLSVESVQVAAVSWSDRVSMVAKTRVVAARAQEPQSDLFGPDATVHDLLASVGNAKEAVDAATRATLDGEGGSLARVVAGRGGKSVVAVARNTAIREIEGISERGYSYSAWSLAGLPHRKPPPGDWVIETDIARLVVSPGSKLQDDNTTLSVGVPYGVYARLALVAWQTEVLLRGSREIHMGDSARRVLDWLRVPQGGKVADLALEQLYRLSTCTLAFHFRRRGQSASDKTVSINSGIVKAYEWSQRADSRRKQAQNVIERVLLTDEFYNEVRRHPVLIDRAAIMDLSSSSLALDVYLWLAFRLHDIREETPVSWSALAQQFGKRGGVTRNFRLHFETPLHLALSAYSRAKVRIIDRGLILFPSPPPLD
jgi:hypothetical protein